ncbi:MAG: Glutamyl-tRNA synthetase [Candidatus Woesebacteria bacterium GW2011_GWB1_43_14]|uniref:Glutamate--tRNA ligase n=1 Tax=Candidatus Woesebacteria bacterium GW2011_GWB1_43_14 TaxID=1618578 RepID=A0A0G1FQP0_9BACT|nr:MAG: Glutamyl-tRNA synthetase [Candidatus Woesebacteria bacterium GW2011_GWA1_39_11b]KKS78069.1 MAG: Glutamyl-tRNA synthetase [Candidatus Woesebacteria bacterium GW2011_GWC1_42_9]KKS97351.1 MAG: Glutamyl-tRNA synthetase [Candidatus Woesebacteria bacterium GW2011_GWB1_43_14]
MIRVRIAPSPTGLAHIGTAYTALFNYAFAKKNKGRFVVRIEDTDQKRHIKEAEKAIFEGLTWLGIDWDESVNTKGEYGPYRQSERLKLYDKKAKELLSRDLAYKDKGAVRFKNPGIEVVWDDLVKGKISFPGTEITDFVIIKSDGFPTYNFAVTIDDIEMKITHVIRGEEHVSNTPRQLALYKAFGVNPPFFAHHPTLRNKDHKKLSKRRDPVDIGIYKKQGYLPEALINFLALLGWSHPKGKEIFGLQEFIDNFSLERVRKSGPFFNIEKLDWLNGQYIKNMSDSELFHQLKIYLGEDYNLKMVEKTVPLVRDRIKNFSEYISLAGFFFEEPEAVKDLLGENARGHLEAAYQFLKGVKKWNRETINKGLLEVIATNEFHTGEFFMDLRIAVSGQKVTPPINESIALLGKDIITDRIKKLI